MTSTLILFSASILARVAPAKPAPTIKTLLFFELCKVY